MNNLLATLQEIHRAQSDTGDFAPLGDIPTGDWSALSPTEAKAISQWVVQTPWPISLEMMYDCMSWLHCPGNTVLNHLCEAGHAQIVLDSYAPTLSPQNCVMLAHTLQVARNQHLLDDTAVPVLKECFDNGDPQLLLDNIIIWTNDMSLVPHVVWLGQSKGADLTELIVNLGDLVRHSVENRHDSPYDKQMREFGASLLNDPQFAPIVVDLLYSLEYQGKHKATQCPDVYHMHLQNVLENCSWDTAVKALEYTHSGFPNVAQRADELLPFFPERLRYDLARLPIFESGENATQIRLNKTLGQVVKEIPAPVSAVRKM